MTIAVRLMAAALAVSLTGNPAPPHPDTLGVVTQARDANLGTGPVSAGTTLYALPIAREPRDAARPSE
jgi:hypothetical protein